MNFNNNETPTFENILMGAIANALADTHTVAVCKITKVNKTTINCKPVISRVVDGKKVDLPNFIEVPVLTLMGGGSSIQMPISVGDYCVVFVSERCLDGWYSGQDFSKPLENRMHDYSDSIAFVGLKNKGGELTIPKIIEMIGNAHQQGDYTHDGNRVQNGDFNLNGNMAIDGNLTVNGSITTTGDVIVNGISFLGHAHPGDSGGITGTPQ